MFIDTNKISPEGLRFDKLLQLRPLESDAAEGLRVLHARAHGAAQREARGVSIEGSLEARLELPCSRCVEPCSLSIEAGFELFLVRQPVPVEPGETELDPEKASLLVVPDGRADLAAIALEQIYLNLPLKPVCSPECRGLCATCGGNRNHVECACDPQELDPRLSPLKQLKERLGKP